MGRYSYCFTKKSQLITLVATIFSPFSIVSINGASVPLAWDINPEPNIAGYRLHYGTASHDYTEHIDVGTSTTATISNLVAGITYFFAATAYDTNAVESGFSNEVVHTPADPIPTPVPTGTPPPPGLTPTPTPVPSPAPTATPSFVGISGNVTYCSSPAAVAIPNVIFNLTGSVTSSTVSDLLGNYRFSALPIGGSYSVAASKAALLPGAAGITTVDVIAAQRHFLSVMLLPPGCQRTAGDVNRDGTINTLDVVAIAGFYLGFSTGVASVGQYQFIPVSRSYSSLGSSQVGQNFDALILGDIGPPFVERAAGSVPYPTTSSRVTRVSLPEVAVDPSVTNFVVHVTTTSILADDHFVGFQGDFTFDERVVTFQGTPVQRAGLTDGNWNVAANILAGDGPVRTLRILAYSTDFVPLSGTGTLFDLNMSLVSTAPGDGSMLSWADGANTFVFIDADLRMQAPRNTEPGNVTVGATQ